MRHFTAVLVFTLALAGCQGVPIGHYRYRAAQEPLELLVGAVALPFALVGDALVGYLFLADPWWTGYALSLVSPLHNAWDRRVGPTECPELEEGVAVTVSRRQVALEGEADAVLGAARAHLAEEGWTLERLGDARWKLRTAWRSEEKGEDTVLLQLRVRVYPPEVKGDPVRVRARLIAAATAGALVPPSRFAPLRERLAAIEREQEAAEDEVEDEEDDVDLISYYSHGERSKDARRDELDACRAPAQRRAEGAADDLLEVEDELFQARVTGTREALTRQPDEPLRAVWERLLADFQTVR